VTPKATILSRIASGWSVFSSRKIAFAKPSSSREAPSSSYMNAM